MPVCVFAGSAPASDPRHLPVAARLGRHLAGGPEPIVYGGGSRGAMGAMADAALAAGATVVGIVPTGLFAPEEVHPGVEVVEVATLHDRKFAMLDRSDAFVALPGGFGTLDEVGEVLTWSQLGVHHKPVVLVDADGFWDDLVTWVDRAIRHGYVPATSRALLTVVAEPEAVLDAIAAYVPPPSVRTLTRDQT